MQHRLELRTRFFQIRSLAGEQITLRLIGEMVEEPELLLRRLQSFERLAALPPRADQAGLGYLLRWQIERAELVLLTKTDVVSAEQQALIEATISEVRPEVKIVPLTRSPDSGELVLVALEEVAAC